MSIWIGFIKNNAKNKNVCSQFINKQCIILFRLSMAAVLIFILFLTMKKKLLKFIALCRFVFPIIYEREKKSKIWKLIVQHTNENIPRQLKWYRLKSECARGEEQRVTERMNEKALWSISTLIEHKSSFFQPLFYFCSKPLTYFLHYFVCMWNTSIANEMIAT